MTLSPPVTRKSLAFLDRMTRKIAERYPRTAEAQTKQLLKHVTGLGLLDFFTDEGFLDEESRMRFEELAERRASGEPLQYLLGEAPFLDFSLRVGSGVLVPRIETETLVRTALDLCRRGDLVRMKRIEALDLGTGSGNIAIGLARGEGRLRVDAAEGSSRAADYARRNISRYGMEDRIRLLRMDFLADSWEEHLRPRYDLILSNPPYIAEGDFDLLPEEVRREPRTALIGGLRGDEILRRLIRGGLGFLPNGGWMLLEMGMGQGGPLREYLREFPDLRCDKIVKDPQGIERVLVIRREIP